MERWEIYAWALRDVLCKEGNFTPTDMPLRIKNEYEAWLKADVKGAKYPTEVYAEYMKSLKPPDIELG